MLEFHKNNKKKPGRLLGLLKLLFLCISYQAYVSIGINYLIKKIIHEFFHIYILNITNYIIGVYSILVNEDDKYCIH